MNVVVHPRPNSVFRSGGALVRQEALDRVWREWVGEEAEQDGDYEDFYEQAARLSAVLEVLGPERVWLQRDAADRAKNLGTGQLVDVADLEGLRRYGTQPTPRIHHSRGFGSAEDYMADESFIRNAGRRAVLAGLGAGSGADIVDAVLEASRANGAVVIKGRRTKSGLWHVDLGQRASRSDVTEALQDTMGWSLVGEEEVPEAFLVQEFTDMRYEYRIFVANGRIVTGAGCVEDHTPLDNEHLFDVQVQERRGVGSIQRRPAEVRSMLDFTRDVVAELGEERPEVLDYTLDVAMGAGGPLVIERNDLLNSGLYASRPEEVVRGLDQSD